MEPDWDPSLAPTFSHGQEDLQNTYCLPYGVQPPESGQGTDFPQSFSPQEPPYPHIVAGDPYSAPYPAPAPYQYQPPSQYLLHPQSQFQYPPQPQSQLQYHPQSQSHFQYLSPQSQSSIHDVRPRQSPLQAPSCPISQAPNCATGDTLTDRWKDKIVGVFEDKKTGETLGLAEIYEAVKATDTGQKSAVRAALRDHITFRRVRRGVYQLEDDPA